MTINNNSVEQINVALLDMDKKIKSTASKSASASDFKNLEASVDNIKRTLDETKAGLEPGKTYNINISGNAATADKAKEANKLVNALTVNGKTYNGSEAVDAGVQEIENGGTGATDVNGAEFNITAGMKSQTSDFTDTTKITCVQESPSISNGRFFYSSASYLWNYIKDKISSVLGLTSEKVSSYDSHLTNKDNPHSVTKSQVGLDAVVNTGDSATPVSGGTTKFTTGGAYTELNKKVDKVDGKGLSSNDFTDTYKDKLDNIDTTVTTGSSNLVTSGAVETAISTEVTNRNTAITNAINNLDVSSVGGDGKYISAISETDGKISATSTTMDTAPTANSVNAVTSGGIKTAISTAETNAKDLANATGTLAVANGGTGVTSQADINKAFIGNLDVGTSDVTDGTEFVSSWASDNGFAETAEGALNKPYKRKFIKVWNYIKGKISSVLGLTKDTYGGKAAKSSFLDEYVGAGGTRLTSGNIVPKDASEYGGIRKDIVSDSMTDSGRPGQDGHLLTMFWDNAGRYDSQFFVSNNNPLTVKARVKANGTDYGNWVDVITSNNIGSQTVAKAGTADRTIGINYTGESDGCISAEQTSESYNNSDANWASYIICNHGNGTTYYHQMLRLSFFSDSIQFQRRVGGELQGWKNVAIMENENTWSGRQNFSTAKASSKMVIPIGEPSSLEDGCLWIER